MDTLAVRAFAILSEAFQKHRIRAFVYVGISSIITFAMMGLTCLFTFMYMAHKSELDMEKMAARLLMDVCNESAEAAFLQGKIEAYKRVITAFCKDGRRKALGKFTVTAYDPVESCKPFDDGLTAKSIPVGMGVVAVNAGVIPYGSVLYLPELGRYFFACDTGAAMKKGDGRNIDLLVPTVDKALAFGRRRLAVELIDLSGN